MQDLEQGNYMVYELARTRRGNGRRSFYAYQVRMGKEFSSSGCGFYIRVTGSRVTSAPDYSKFPPKSNIYRHNTYSSIVPTIAGHFGRKR